ncbi:hypothetical protein H6503_01755 [Candidatus Woesearchaeota archaeon]|nr:hypothetical protein [Candidatus Woesearchaeota archaeon]
MSKKSQTNIIPWSLGGLVLMLVAIVILIGFLSKAGNVLDEKAFDKACNDYIKYSILSAKFGFNSDLGDAPCRTEEILIDGDSDFDIMNKVLERQAACFNSFDRGNSELLKFSNMQDITFCSVCSELTFSDKNFKMDGHDYVSFLGLKSRSGERYVDILAPVTFASSYETGTWRADASLDATIIDGSKKYITVMRYEKKTGAFWRWFKTMKAKDDSEEFMLLGKITGFQTVHDDYNVALLLAEFDSSTLKQMECDVILGIQQPGITSSS